MGTACLCVNRPLFGCVVTWAADKPSSVTLTHDLSYHLETVRLIRGRKMVNRLVVTFQQNIIYKFVSADSRNAKRRIISRLKKCNEYLCIHTKIIITW